VCSAGLIMARWAGAVNQLGPHFAVVSPARLIKGGRRGAQGVSATRGPESARQRARLAEARVAECAERV
jgi:hypothetical protein